MEIEIKNLDLNYLQRQTYEQNPKKAQLTTNTRKKVIAMFNKLKNKTKLSFTNNHLTSNQTSTIKYELTTTKLTLLVKTNIKTITFEYFLEQNTLFINSHPPQPKHIHIFIKTLNQMHNSLSDETIPINLT